MWSIKNQRKGGWSREDGNEQQAEKVEKNGGKKKNCLVISSLSLCYIATGNICVSGGRVRRLWGCYRLWSCRVTSNGETGRGMTASSHHLHFLEALEGLMKADVFERREANILLGWLLLAGFMP